MEYVRLGSTGLKVSRICLGMMSYGDPARGSEWILDEEAAEPIVRKAAEAGVTFFDTADTYSAGSSEEVTGRLLSKLFAHRDDYVLATKVFFPVGPGSKKGGAANDRGLSRKHIMSAIDASLRRLGTEYVDLYQIHRWDPDTPIEETMQALHDVVRAGKARYLGASSMSAWQFAKAQHVAETNGWTKFVSMQNHYNLLYREEEREMVPLCLDQGVGMIPWSPLARGLLARAGRQEERGTARAGSDPRIGALYGDAENDSQVLDRVAEVARERGVAPASVALSWLLRQPGVAAPIIGATRAGHVDDAVAAVEVDLTDKEVGFLAEPYRPRAVAL
ncbi:aldo/keto reductase [Streptosporangium sandarakinum]|uniref:aldo/keto reductase n=1 Tax=Streptosporangium sandarakinum TaxID=1260955 RepID=UPI0033A55954